MDQTAFLMGRNKFQITHVVTTGDFCDVLGAEISNVNWLRDFGI